jgi:predicted NodU family carbamoyl transferase
MGAEASRQPQHRRGPAQARHEGSPKQPNQAPGTIRPFPPSILVKRVGDYLEETHPSPFMLMAYKVKPEKRSVIPAPTHVEGTGRLQTMGKEENPVTWKLIKAFETHC